MMNLTMFLCLQGIKEEGRAPAKRGCDRGSRGPTSWAAKRLSMMEGHRGRESAKNLIAEAAVAYRDETNEGIRKLIDDREVEIKHEREPDEEIED